MRGPCVAHMMAAALLVVVYCIAARALKCAFERPAIVRRRADLSAVIMVPA